jgi:hypothetical protein
MIYDAKTRYRHGKRHSLTDFSNASHVPPLKPQLFVVHTSRARRLGTSSKVEAYGMLAAMRQEFFGGELHGVSSPPLSFLLDITPLKLSCIFM